MKELKILSLFSGIGAFEKALYNINIDYKLIGFSEIDKYAIKSYCAIHNVSESKNLGDITKIEITKLPKDIDLITHGSPCQDLKIRKLTPLECWRLMGFTDEDFKKVKEINSNTQLYKQAGNSIVVKVLEKIFENLLN